jgi:hypothetical protein
MKPLTLCNYMSKVIIKMQLQESFVEVINGWTKKKKKAHKGWSLA